MYCPDILIHVNPDGRPRIKVTDFGLARVFDPQSPMLSTRCGSEEYAAPEIVQGLGYDGRRTDTWALGIILYAMLVGGLPFSGGRVSHMFYKIVSVDYSWPTSVTVSDAAKEVVSRILVRKPEKRITIPDIRTLAWLA